MRTRGQATVELALGTVVFVPILLIGIYFAEYGQLALKVQDAQAYTVWESTGRRVQERRGGTVVATPLGATLDPGSGIAPIAQLRFGDFNGLDSVRRDIITQALTRGSNMEIACTEDRALDFPAQGVVQRTVLNRGGLSCKASAKITAINIPRLFAGKEIFSLEPVTVCGMGLPTSGQCLGKLAILTNDWGFDEEIAACKNTCSGGTYHDAVKAMWTPGYGAALAFAARYAGTPESSPNDFAFSYPGVENAMMDRVGGEGDHDFNTGGAGIGMVPKFARPACFLGRCP